jgi:diguanylate cyclase (GGDEF)-like protein
MPPATLTLSPHDAALAADVESTSGLSLLEHVADAGLWRLDLARGTFHGSPRLRAWLAVAPSDPLHLDFVAEPWRDGLQARVRACACLGDPFDCHVQVITGAGLQWARILGHAVRRADGQIASVEGAVQAISPRATSSGALATVDATGRLNYLNAQAERLLARRAARLQGRRVCSLFEKTARLQVQQAVHAALAQGQPLVVEALDARQRQWLALSGEPFADGLALQIRDVTERQASEQRIRHLAFYDALTGLPNRQLLLDRLHASLDQLTGVQAGALMFIDLDNFKVLNDTRGHHKGDLLLQQVAARLQACVARDDTVARLGGDEFVILLAPHTGGCQRAAKAAAGVASGILRALGEPYPLPDGLHHSTCSIGITVFGPKPVGVSELLKQADLAMYQAKREGRNTVCFFEAQRGVDGRQQA